MSATAAPKRLTQLSDEELGHLLGLLRGSDSAELKLTLPEAGHRSAARALGMDPLAAQIRQVFFFDTPDLALNRAGVVARARRVQGREHDSVVKLRPVVPDELPAKLRKSPHFTVEVDAMPGGYVCSGTLKRMLGPAAVGDAVADRRPVRKLFSKTQRAFFAEHAPDGIELDALPALGPVFVLKQNLRPKGFGRKLTAEMWLYPDGSRILELSTKCAPKETFNVAAEARAFLTGKGLDLSGAQQTKTKAALRFFSREQQG